MRLMATSPTQKPCSEEASPALRCRALHGCCLWLCAAAAAPEAFWAGRGMCMLAYHAKTYRRGGSRPTSCANHEKRCDFLLCNHPCILRHRMWYKSSASTSMC